MSETQFAMVSEWMQNGNINQFVKTHRGANRFELVSFPFRPLLSSLLVNNSVISAAGRCGQGLDLYARSGNGPRGSQGGMFSRARGTFYL